MTTDEQIGALAKSLRERQRMTQAQVVEAARARGFKITVPALSTLERGRRGWNTTYIDAVAAGLGEDPAVFIAEPDGPLARVERAARDFFDALVDAVRTPGIAG